MIKPLERSSALLDQKSFDPPGKDYLDSFTSLNPSNETITH